MISLDIPLRFEGIITVQCHDGKGELLHEETQKNLIVNDGWASLGDRALGDDLLNNCILGRSGRAPTLGDLFDGPAESYPFSVPYTPDCPDVPPGTACAEAPERTVVAVSDDNGGTADGPLLVDADGETYWQLIRKRQFTRHTDYFHAGASTVMAGTCASGQSAWVAQGWGSLDKEASFIKEIAFCSDAPTVYEYVRDCVTVPEWSSSLAKDGRLWNRVTLDTSIGYASDSPYSVPDVVFPHDTVITVTLDIRVHLSKVARVQVVDVDGVPTTCSTQIQKLEDGDYWHTGFLLRFGNWPTSTRAATIAQGNVLPAVDEKYDGDGSSAPATCSEVSSGTGVLVLRYNVETWDGNWVGGVGGIEHANFTSHFVLDRPVFVTVFTPKIAKTDLEEIDFDFRYTWSQKS